MVNQENGKWLR